jgi:hypothetical protein
MHLNEKRNIPDLFWPQERIVSMLFLFNPINSKQLTCAANAVLHNSSARRYLSTKIKKRRFTLITIISVTNIRWILRKTIIFQNSLDGFHRRINLGLKYSFIKGIHFDTVVESQNTITWDEKMESLLSIKIN